MDEWWKEMDSIEEEDKKERRHAEINERETEELEKSRNKAGTDRLCGPFAYLTGAQTTTREDADEMSLLLAGICSYHFIKA